MPRRSVGAHLRRELPGGLAHGPSGLYIYIYICIYIYI